MGVSSPGTTGVATLNASVLSTMGGDCGETGSSRVNVSSSVSFTPLIKGVEPAVNGKVLKVLLGTAASKMWFTLECVTGAASALIVASTVGSVLVSEIGGDTASEVPPTGRGVTSADTVGVSF